MHVKHYKVLKHTPCSHTLTLCWFYWLARDQSALWPQIDGVDVRASGTVLANLEIGQCGIVQCANCGNVPLGIPETLTEWE